MGRPFEPCDMLRRREMARLMRISTREFSRRVKNGEIPPGRPYFGGQPRWPAFIGYYFVFAEYMAAWNKGEEVVHEVAPEAASQVYFIRAGDRVKIGTACDPVGRLRNIQTGNPDTLELLHAMPGKHADERRLHKKFNAHRTRPGGEWFHYADEIREYVEQLKTG